MELLKIKCPLKLLYFSGFTITRLLPLQSACFRNAPKEQSHLITRLYQRSSRFFPQCRQNSISRSASCLCTPCLAAGQRQAAVALLNLHVAAASVHPSLPFLGGKDYWLKVHPGSTACISCRGRATLSIYKSLSTCTHWHLLLQCAVLAALWFLREACKDPKGIKRMMTLSTVCGVGFYHLWMKPAIHSQNTISNAPGFLLFLSASVQRLKQVPVLLITGLKRSKTQREPCQQALLSHPAGMSHVANCLLN